MIAIILAAEGNSALAQDSSRAVEGGGISVQGWVGRIDPKEMAAGAKLENAKLAKDADALHVTTGPAVVYWKPDNKATGDYTLHALNRHAPGPRRERPSHPRRRFPAAAAGS
jgi:hypothetical protein